MNTQLINISFPDIFKRYSLKYNIYRELYEQGQLGLELREVNSGLLDRMQKMIFERNEICYKKLSETGETGDLLFTGSIATFREIARDTISFGNEDLGHRITSLIRNYLAYDNTGFSLCGRNVPPGESLVMGILNITPDSFSDGGRYFEPESAIEHARQMISDGVDIIDIGGESTRPGSESVSESEETRRVIPVIEKILEFAPDTLISVDTTKKNVAHEALKTGAKIINDISGLTFEPEIAHVVKEFDAALVVMHIKGTPRDMQLNPYYDDVTGEVYDFLSQRVTYARKAGVRNIIIDPGIGFGKRLSDNYEILKRLDEFKGMGYPILIGLSRKAFLGKTLDGLEVSKRDTASVIAEALSIRNGARIIRTHNVKNAVQAKKILKCLSNPEDIKLNV
ncbi:MAG: dihydropteroate synthase [Ignavibacteria bacterium]|nr:dihydropteroate synthase [Ignavibacteria bacterium]MCU7501516.1 dihydropteroate synthase [Ignavibacteria bacterium]MCU7515968.1 dihydropteroate synthase [Ignavibacteria bacterium]